MVKDLGEQKGTGTILTGSLVVMRKEFDQQTTQIVCKLVGSACNY